MNKAQQSHTIKRNNILQLKAFTFFTVKLINFLFVKISILSLLNADHC